MTTLFIANIRYRHLLTLAAFAVIGAQSAAAAPNGDLQVKDITAHHVRISGKGFDKTHTDLFNHMTETCKAMGKSPEPLPSGEAVHQQVRDIYYAAGGVTTYIRKQTYSLHPESCRLQRTEHLEIRMRTASGTCTISPKRKRAVGECDIHPLVTGKTMLVRDNPNIRPTGKTMMIAGLKCSVFAGTYAQMNIEYCIARAGSFTGIPSNEHSSHPGLLLKTATWLDRHPDEKTTDFEATEVATDIKVGIEVLAPHIAGGYNVSMSKGEN